MNVLSLFDGMSCGQIAISKAGVSYSNYFASEIEQPPMAVTMRNYPNTKQIGDVTKVSSLDLPDIDLLIGGSPCQGFSFAGKQLNFDDPRSILFFEFVRLKNELNPKFFLLENVKMKKEYQDIISQYLGVQPILINSSLVSAQNRERLYWTNIPFNKDIKDRGIILSDILENTVNERYILTNKAYDYMGRLRNGKPRWEYHKNPLRGKAACLTANMYKGVPYGVIKDLNRRLTPVECERLQTVPDDYTSSVADIHRYKMLGNGWTVDVLAHIFKTLKNLDLY